MKQSDLIKSLPESVRKRNEGVLGKVGSDGAVKSKYGSKVTIVDGIRYDSKKEACRHRDLLFLESIGEISGLRRQVVYQLSVCKYKADHVYFDRSGIEIVEDTKSKHTRTLPVYRLKKKMMFSEMGIAIKEQ